MELKYQEAYRASRTKAVKTETTSTGRTKKYQESKLLPTSEFASGHGASRHDREKSDEQSERASRVTGSEKEPGETARRTAGETTAAAAA